MADNVTANSGSGGPVFATDDISDVHYPIQKIAYGPLDTATLVDSNNSFPVSLGAGTLDTFGSLKTATLNPQIDIQWYRDTPAALATITTANSGTAATSIGGALFSSSTNTNGSVRAETFTRLRYHGGAEIYAIFTAAFNTGLAATNVRLGTFTHSAGTPQNGAYIGYEGTTFQIGYVNNGGTPSTVAKASWNVDTLTGAAGSKFTRDGTPEAINLTFLNVWRIRYGWVGGAQIYYEVLSPDGGWVTFHIVKFPNTVAAVSFRDADLPFVLDITKTAAAATNVTVFCGCWVLGNSIAPTDHSVIGQGAQTTLNNNICLDVAGSGPLDCFQYKSIALQIVPASGTVTAGAITFEASNDNVNWGAVALQDATITTDGHASTYSLAASTPRYFTGPIHFRYFRARISTGVTGTTTGIQCLTQLRVEPYTPLNTHCVQATAADLNATVVISPSATGGLSTYHLVSAGTTNLVNVKASAGQLMGWYVYNSNASMRKLCFHNTAGTPTAGASIFFTLPIPGGSAANVMLETGIAFGTGIGISTVTDLADSGTTAVAANDLNINLFYK